MKETILSKLKEEHQEIQMLLLRVDRCKGPVKKMEYYDILKKALIPHMEGEERSLYAHLKDDVQNENANEIAGLANYEHQEIKDMLKMLDAEEIESKEWDELFNELQENIRSHFEEEEKDLFNEAKEDFSREELEELTREFEEAKSHSSYH